MAAWPWFVLVGAGLGLLTGFFGVGGSAIATPLFSLMGVPGLQAVASPLPATIPAAVGAAVPYVTAGTARTRTAAWSVAGALPATVAGALLSGRVGGSVLLMASGAVLTVVGVRVLRPVQDTSSTAGTARRHNRPLLLVASAGVGLFTGLLANGGGFLLVPMYLLIFGLDMQQSAGTSLVVISVITVPTTVAHWALGHIDWSVALAYALGAVPASAVSGRVAQRAGSTAVMTAFGWFLVAAGGVFVTYRVVAR